MENSSYLSSSTSLSCENRKYVTQLDARIHLGIGFANFVICLPSYKHKCIDAVGPTALNKDLRTTRNELQN